MAELTEWDSFYVIVGASAGALIGLQFVVMTLLADRPPKGAAEASAAFASPTVVHFGAVLYVAALLCAPWHALGLPAVLWGLGGLCGVGYVLLVARRMRRQDAYRPQLEDWVFHAALPLVGYAVLALSSLLAASHARESLFAVAGAALLLLFAGIHNSWDAVAYQALVNRREGNEP